mmetsp:Transcript_30779/g.28007  ORF Transcript_30779/g.28007 Transcript_30779/m.28007 type:complete len:82 (+) Transcript_30779:2663-2908(+)
MLNLKNFNDNLYDQVISTFEQLIMNFSPEDVDLFFETFFHSDYIKKTAKTRASTLLIDLMALLSIHISLGSNPMIIERIYQ